MKQLFICKEHHHALVPWANVRRTKEELNLLTFDHHTDTHDAFLYYLYYNKTETLENLIEKIDINNHATIKEAITKLRNDEHIDTAVKIGIFKKSFSVSYDGSFDKPPSNEWTEMHKTDETKIPFMMGMIKLPEVLTYPDAKLYEIGTSEILDYENSIADELISFVLSKINIMAKIDIMQTNYILDIDLDYFKTYDALNRNDLKLFRDLLSQATAITIATEPDFASEGVDSEIILEQIIEIAKNEIGTDIEIIDLR